MNVKNVLIWSIISGSSVSMLGCASASNATDSTFSYLRGDQRATLGATPPKIVAATVAAANELALPVDSQSADGLIGKVMMHSTNGAKIEVNVKGEINDQSEVAVRVGTFGDKTLQQRVLDKIKAHLVAGISPSTTVSPPALSLTPPPAPSTSPAQTPVVSPPPSLSLDPVPPPSTKPDQVPEPANPLAIPATVPN